MLINYSIYFLSLFNICNNFIPNFKFYQKKVRNHFINFNHRDAENEPISEEKLDESFKDFYASISYFKNYIKKTISFEDKLYTVRVIIELYLLMKISSLFNDKFFLLLATNICLFYSPLDKKYPYFVLKIRMSVKQIIEGVIVLILCLVPKYEEEQKEQKIE